MYDSATRFIHALVKVRAKTSSKADVQTAVMIMIRWFLFISHSQAVKKGQWLYVG